MSLGLVHEITGRCNLSCTFCYNPWNIERTCPPELDPDANGALLERVLADSCAQWLTFTGGEPLLYDGLVQVMTHVHRRFPKVSLGLATNGILLPQRLEALVGAGLGYLEISLFAAESGTFAALAGGGGPAPAFQAVAAARARGVPVTVSTVLRAGLGRELEDLIRRAHALGAERMALNRFVARGRGRRHAQALSLSPAELDGLLSLSDRLARELDFPILVTTPVENCLLSHRHYPHLAFGPCACARSKWAIDPEGFLRCCELDDRRLGNLREQGFRELARAAAAEAFRQACRTPACGTCPALPRCGGGCRFA